MRRHFLGLFLLIIATLAVASWAQDRILSGRSNALASDETLKLATQLLRKELSSVPEADWHGYIASALTGSEATLEMFGNQEIVGEGTMESMRKGEIVHLKAGSNEMWSMQQFDATHVLALKSTLEHRDALDWAVTLGFYGLIALVLMLWLWPLARDLRDLEKATARFGDRNWNFNVKPKPHSAIHRLSEAFRRMAARIDELVSSHKDMTNALSHEIKTPLARMQFELDFAQKAADIVPMKKSLENIKGDVEAINKLVKATLDYAILERAELELNFAHHDFTQILPALVDESRRDSPENLKIRLEVAPGATHVRCDIHLIEAILKNLLNNARRYAHRQIAVAFSSEAGMNRLVVEDDGPGIPEAQQARVFESFVKLDRTPGKEARFGLGLAIVKRAAEWHEGQVALSRSTLGGARFEVSWPESGR